MESEKVDLLRTSLTDQKLELSTLSLINSLNSDIVRDDVKR